jgi:hypothetical protein
LSTILQSSILLGLIVLSNYYWLIRLIINVFAVPRVNFVGGLHCKNQTRWTGGKVKIGLELEEFPWLFLAKFTSGIAQICQWFKHGTRFYFDHQRLLASMGKCTIGSCCKKIMVLRQIQTFNLNFPLPNSG